MIKKLTLIVLLAVIILVGLFLVLSKSKEAEVDSSKMQITASFYPMYFFAAAIGGNKVNAVNITPPGAEPHDYDLTPQDIIKIQKSKLLVLNGSVEPWGNKIKTNLDEKSTQILIAGQGSIINDPHIWLSPVAAKIEAEKIENALSTIDPLNKNLYQENLKSLTAQLNELDKSYKTGLKNCETRSFVTSHAAFGYLAKEYGLTQVAIDGLSPDAEPSLSQLAQIASYAKNNGVKVIFFEALVSPKLSQTVANEIGAKTLVLDPIEGITSSDLSKGVNYLTLMENNLQNLREALNCK